MSEVIIISIFLKTPQKETGYQNIAKPTLPNDNQTTIPLRTYLTHKHFF